MSKERIRCNSCGFRIRGKKHNEGSHHSKRRPEPKLKKKGSNQDDRKLY